MERNRLSILKEALSHVVGNTCRLSRTTATYGWNAVGPGAREMVPFLDRQAGELHNSLDPLARHIRSLGMPVILDYSDVSMTIDPPRGEDVPQLNEMIANLILGHKEACMSLRAAMDLSTEIEEHATTVILAGRLDAHRGHARDLSLELPEQPVM